MYVFEEADDPVVAALPPATLQGAPHGTPHLVILMQFWLRGLAVLALQLFKSVQQLTCGGQDKSLWLKQLALLFCAPTESQAPFLQYRLSSNHIHSSNSQFTNIGR